MGTVILKRVEEAGKSTQHFMNDHAVTAEQYVLAYKSATQLNFKGATGGLGKNKEKHTVVQEAVGVADSLIIKAPAVLEEAAPTPPKPLES